MQDKNEIFDIGCGKSRSNWHVLVQNGAGDMVPRCGNQVEITETKKGRPSCTWCFRERVRIRLKVRTMGGMHLRTKTVSRISQ